jgi:hypothetical protein
VNVRPVVPRRISVTTTPVITSATSASARNDLSEARSHGPTFGRWTLVVEKLSVPPTNGSLMSTESKK